MLKLMYITNDPNVAFIAEKAGVDRLFVDLEYLGKEERQGGLDTVKSKHTESDISSIKQVLDKAKLLVRINPINDDSPREIDNVIANGADIIMLPMFKNEKDVKTFIELVSGRVPTILLLEHIDAVNRLDAILELDGIDEIHIGLNDLHLSMNLKFMFELFTNGEVKKITDKIKQKSIPFGIGGISRLGTGTLPAEMIIAEHYNLGSTGAILSRSFCDLNKMKDKGDIDRVFKSGVKKIREYEQLLTMENDDFFIDNMQKMKIKVGMITDTMRD